MTLPTPNLAATEAFIQHLRAVLPAGLPYGAIKVPIIRFNINQTSDLDITLNVYVAESLSAYALTALNDEVLPGMLRAYKAAHPELALLVIVKLFPGLKLSRWHSVEVDLLH